MPDRIVRAGILTSDAVNKLSWAAEVFYRRLMSVVDDYGRYDGRSSILRANLYPLKIDRVSEPDLAKWILETEEAGLVRRYTVDGKQYLEVVKFGQRLRAMHSKWPPPLTSAVTCQQPLSNAAESEDETETEKKKEGAARPEDSIWKIGVALLVNNGESEKTARSYLGKLIKEFSEAKVSSAIAVVSAKRPADPKGFLLAVLQSRPPPQKLTKLQRANKAMSEAFGNEFSPNGASRVIENVGPKPGLLPSSGGFASSDNADD